MPPKELRNVVCRSQIAIGAAHQIRTRCSGCHEHSVDGLDVKGVVPDIGVSSRTNHAKLARGMRVADDLLFDVIVRDFSAPGLRPAEKHALVALITIENGAGCPLSEVR